MKAASQDPKRVLVTGASGFIGEAVVSRLQGNYEIWGTYSRRPPGHLPGEKALQVDLADRDAVQELRSRLPERPFYAVVHIAGLMPYKHDDIDLMTEVNASGTERLMNGLLHVPQRFAYVSTVDVYGGSDEEVFNEQSRVNPRSNYAITKLMGEDLVCRWCRTNNLPGAILRLSHVYGVRDTSNKVIPTFCRQVAHGRPPTVAGQGTSIRQPVHVDDVAGVIAAFLETSRLEVPPRVCIVAGDQRVSIRELAAMAMASAGLAGSPFTDTDSVSKPPTNCQFDFERTKAALNWKPEVSLEKGLSQVVRCFAQS